MSGKITLSKENVMNRAVVCLSPAGVYPEEVTRKFNDLDMYVRVIVDNGPEWIGSFPIGNTAISDAFGGIDALFNAAMRNTGAGGRLVQMGDILGAFARDAEAIDGENPPIYVLTSDGMPFFGASVAAVRRDLLREACGKHGAARCFVIPSSVHEMLVLPCAGMYGDMSKYSELTGMIQQINTAVVDEKDRLGNHAYIYDAEADSFSYR